ncbi:MAG: hypothetical protein ACK51C_04070 [Brevundimonas sp.]|jgi:hypothetical protein|uniref:hypothetical protein n=1 Tax=Brevundimonas sp. TaxID=1871086 RepID=UPI003918EBFE
MRLRIDIWLAATTAFLALTALAERAEAQCGTGCHAPPEPCCEPPPPPPPPPDCCEPPPPPECCSGNVNVNVNVNVNAGASASARSYLNARAGTAAGSFGRSGGVAYFNVDQPYPTTIQGLNVEAASVARVVRVPYTLTRSVSKRVVIQAFCIDDRGVPHPASQVRPGRDVQEDHEGELYRCLAGTRLQITIAEYEGEVRFDGGETLTCEKGEALWHEPGGIIQCRVQRPERECNERSLLRRYGAGLKILTMLREESYTEYREEIVHEAGAVVVGSSITLDGGVGGRVF